VGNHQHGELIFDEVFRGKAFVRLANA